MTARSVSIASAPPDAVLWDMDGTLVDSEPLWGIAVEELISDLGGKLTPGLRSAIVGTDNRATMQLVRDHLRIDVGEEKLELWHQRMVARVLELAGEGLRPLPGALEALDALCSKRIPMALVTSSPAAVAESSLHHLGRERFAAVVTADDVRRRKPDPEPYLTAARLLGVDPARAWAVEDSPSGAAAAEAAGCTVLLAPEALPSAAGPGRIPLRSLGELL